MKMENKISKLGGKLKIEEGEVTKWGGDFFFVYFLLFTFQKD